MFDKIAEARRKADEIKTKLAAIQVEGVDGKGLVAITLDGNKLPVNVKINDSSISFETKSTLEMAMLDALKEALEKAENVSGSEMKSLMATMLPGIGGMFGK